MIQNFSTFIKWGISNWRESSMKNTETLKKHPPSKIYFNLTHGCALDKSINKFGCKISQIATKSDYAISKKAPLCCTLGTEIKIIKLHYGKLFIQLKMKWKPINRNVFIILAFLTRVVRFILLFFEEEVFRFGGARLNAHCSGNPGLENQRQLGDSTCWPFL